MDRARRFITCSEDGRDAWMSTRFAWVSWKTRGRDLLLWADQGVWVGHRDDSKLSKEARSCWASGSDEEQGQAPKLKQTLEGTSSKFKGGRVTVSPPVLSESDSFINIILMNNSSIFRPRAWEFFAAVVWFVCYLPSRHSTGTQSLPRRDG